MSTGGKIYEVKCPSCGAPLAMTGERITCNFCGSVLERERPAAPEPKVSPPIHEPPPHVVVIQTGYSTRSYSSYSSKSKSSGGCLSALVTLVMIGGAFLAAGWFLLREQLPAITGLSDLANLAQLPGQIINKVSVTSLNRIILLPDGSVAAPDFLTFTYQNSASTYALTYVDVLSSTIRWQGPPLKEWYNAKILSSPDRLYFSDETKLYALNRSDGQVAWQTSLADKLVSSCLNCFELIDNSLVALVQGGTVQGFNAQTGQLIWNKRLNFEPGSRLVPAGSQVVIFDRTQDNRSNLVYVVNPASGDMTAEITIQECNGKMFDLHHPLFFDPKRGQLYLISGDIIGPPCVQAWDLAGQKMVQQIVFDGLALPMDFSEYVSEQPKALLAGDQLYFSAKQAAITGDGAGVVIKVNLAEGTWQALAPSTDYEFIPLAVSDNLLIVRATRNRGTARNELWGVDLASGKPRWQYVLQGARWVKETGSEAAWDWQLTPQGLAVLQILSDPDQLTVETLNPQTGVSSGQKTIPLRDSHFSGIAWSDSAAWLALDKIYKVDLQKGTLAYTWP